MFNAYITLILIAITGLIGGAVYAYLFSQSHPPSDFAKATSDRSPTSLRRAPLRQGFAGQAGLAKRMINLVGRFFLIGGIFWYLLHLNLTARILFLVVFIGSFWCCIIVTQRRYYGRN